MTTSADQALAQADRAVLYGWVLVHAPEIGDPAKRNAIVDQLAAVEGGLDADGLPATDKLKAALSPILRTMLPSPAEKLNQDIERVTEVVRRKVAGTLGLAETALRDIASRIVTSVDLYEGGSFNETAVELATYRLAGDATAAHLFAKQQTRNADHVKLTDDKAKGPAADTRSPRERMEQAQADLNAENIKTHNNIMHKAAVSQAAIDALAESTAPPHVKSDPMRYLQHWEKCRMALEQKRAA